MPNVDFKINPKFKIQTFYVGVEKTPVLVIDDLLADVQPAIDYACTTAEFSAEKASYYPGVRAEVSLDYARATLTAIVKILYGFFRIPEELKLIPMNGTYSLVSRNPEQLDPLQCIPHFDSSNPHYLAIMHFLNPGEFGGTSFYRHRPTGFENISTEREDSFLNAAQAYLDQHGGKPPQRYTTGSDDHFEAIGSVGYKQNRLVVYPGTLLHSGNIDPARDISSNPRTGRLTANIFVDFE